MSVRRLFYRIPEAAEALGMARSSVYELIEQGVLPVVHPSGPSGSMRLYVEHVEEYARRLASEAREEWAAATGGDWFKGDEAPIQLWRAR